MKILKMTGRILGAVAAAVGLVAFIAPVLKYGLLNVGNLTGMALCGWMLVLCVTPLPRLFKRYAVTRWLFRVINVCYAIFLLYGAVVTGAILLACSDTPAPNATAVVLGAQVKGTNPSVILYGRIQAAERYLQENPEAKAVLTGGKGSDEQISEADCMYNVMVAEGIDPQRLIKEDKATDTKENDRAERTEPRHSGGDGRLPSIPRQADRAKAGRHRQARCGLRRYRLGVRPDLHRPRMAGAADLAVEVNMI